MTTWVLLFWIGNSRLIFDGQITIIPNLATKEECIRVANNEIKPMFNHVQYKCIKILNDENKKS